jgi:hypothetical protein
LAGLVGVGQYRIVFAVAATASVAIRDSPMTSAVELDRFVDCDGRLERCLPGPRFYLALHCSPFARVSNSRFEDRHFRCKTDYFNAVRVV